jgi:hypothetical protein
MVSIIALPEYLSIPYVLPVKNTESFTSENTTARTAPGPRRHESTKKKTFSSSCVSWCFRVFVVAFALVTASVTRARRVCVQADADVAQRVIEDARDHGLLLLNCGPHKNVVRLLPPLTADAEEVGRGLEILDRAAGGGGRTMTKGPCAAPYCRSPRCSAP